MLADLHCHSYYSDGKHSPEFLVSRAMANGVTHLAITDHDYITWEEPDSTTPTDLQLIPGVEVSCLWGSREIHVVGLFIDPSNTDLQSMLMHQRQRRRQRVKKMAQKLEKQGVEGLTSYLNSLPCIAWTRSHVAQFLVQQGHARNWQKAFSRYLSRNGRIYVPFDCCAMEMAIAAINCANGIAILAHPGRYGLSKTKLERLLSDFGAAGGEALEGSYGNIDPISRKLLCELASKYNLHISVGSDFHDADRHWTDLGKLPALESAAKKNAIWHHPRWHF